MEEAAEKRGKGRPVLPAEEKIDKKFHLVLLMEEMDLFKVAAKLAGFPTVSAYLRMAIHAVDDIPNTIIPDKLKPQPSDRTTKHTLILLSQDDRDKLDQAGRLDYSRYIRAAGLALAFSNPRRNAAWEEAVKKLEIARAAAADQPPKAKTTRKR